MKHKALSALLVLLLMLLIPVTASADVIYPAPEDFTVGVEVNHLLATLDPGGSVWTDPGLLPDGLYVSTAETEDGVNVYLCGVPTTPGTYVLLFRYNETDSICTVNILPEEEPAPVPVGVTVFALPLVTEYTAGDVLDPEGLGLLVTLSDGSSFEVTEGYSLYPTRLLNAGTQSIEVNYEGLLCYFDVEVAPAPELIEGIGVLRLPEKVVYRVGEELDPAGLVIRVYTNNGTRDQSSELICSPILLTEPGQQEITVSYMNRTCVFTVQVLAEETAKSIAVYHLPNKLDYQVGEELDTRGLVLVETGDSLEPQLVEDDFTCYPTLFTEPGRQEVTVQRGELSCSFHVTVMTAAAPEPSGLPAADPSLPAMPTSVVIHPAPETVSPRVNPVDQQRGPGLAAVIVAAAAAALLILGVYVFAVNRSGKEYFAESVRDLFRRRR